ncbi:Ppx/GppA phosphatase family protein [Rufibacter tibetensis]|uniref:Phosphatase n=1 Tax=Rufibacter tibetensis TaxID=512763 RepID=A0A0N7HX34_9BACT|nr:phosphatase [Rufibacter tibetensis]ALJ00937.1 phosphatase [Rufibacter tibetensis]
MSEATEPFLKLAAIDIGSNAVRCQISNVFRFEDHTLFKRVEYIRYPMRLGEDVFATGIISRPKADKFIKLLHGLYLIMQVHEVDDFMACATSAMRSAENAPEIIDEIYDKLGLQIQVIDGTTEADLINLVIRQQLDNQNYLHIDVGGGSTEFNIYVNRMKVASQSFEQGSIRHMQGDESMDMWHTMQKWVTEKARMHHVTSAIGTGGNINKIYEMAGKLGGKPIFRDQIEEIVQQIASYSMEERVKVLLLNVDRADVIVPAAEIYLSAMNWANVESMLVPQVGLKDGMLQSLYERHQGATQHHFKLDS